jgi:hypothetical protein
LARSNATPMTAMTTPTKISELALPAQLELESVVEVAAETNSVYRCEGSSGFGEVSLCSRLSCRAPRFGTSSIRVARSTMAPIAISFDGCSATNRRARTSFSFTGDFNSFALSRAAARL